MSGTYTPETSAHGNETVSKGSTLIEFRGRMDHAEAVVIEVQARLQESLFVEEGSAAGETRKLIDCLQEVLDALRACVSAEYRCEPVTVDRLFGLTLDEVQERSHHASEYYGVPTMTRPDYKYGETYAGLNLIRTELRLAESAAVRLYEETGTEGGPDESILLLLNRLSSYVHVLMCAWLSKTAYYEL